jgi:poly-gamma-glutamate synthesis protein (capsule biosynthesis protein)
MSTLALAGDTMLGRLVAAHLIDHPVDSLFGRELRDVLAAADAVLLNLECCISERGRPVEGRVFHFRAPPKAADALRLLGVQCVTLANNHALDFGEDALLDTLDHLAGAGIAAVGAGPDESAARAPVHLTVGDTALTVVAFTDHPVQYAAAPDRPGVAYADIDAVVPSWVTDAVTTASSGAVLVTPHWGPNMTIEPPPYIQRAAGELIRSGAYLVAGHSAHVFHGVAGPVLYDLGDFLDDYAVDPLVRNDLGLLWLVEFAGPNQMSVDAVPLRLTRAHTTLAHGPDAEWITARLRRACADLGTTVAARGGRLHVELAT